MTVFPAGKTVIAAGAAPPAPGPVTEARLVDVAALAGVCPGTASRALRPETRHLVADDTARKVDAAAEAFGYHVDQPARSLRTGHTCTVGLVTAVLGPAGYMIITAPVGRDGGAAALAGLPAVVAPPGRAARPRARVPAQRRPGKTADRAV